MLGFADVWIAAAYILCILCTVLCAVYGAANWNRGSGQEMQQVMEEIDWQKNDADSQNGE